MEKQNLIDKKDSNPLTPNYKSLNNEKKRELKRYNSCINIEEENRDNKYNNIINKIKSDSKQLHHSSSTRVFSPINPKDCSKEILTNIITHFDKNHNSIVRDRNWWKINK